MKHQKQRRTRDGHLQTSPSGGGDRQNYGITYVLCQNKTVGTQGRGKYPRLTRRKSEAGLWTGRIWSGEEEPSGHLGELKVNSACLEPKMLTGL